MPESQNIEYKQSWHDECLKWRYGFAEAYVEISSERFRKEFGNEMASEAGRMEAGNNSVRMKFPEE